MELALDDNLLLRGLASAQKRMKEFAKFTLKAGAVVGGLGASGLAAFKPALDALGEQAKIGDLAELFNITGEKASRLFGIMAAGGSDLRDAQEGLATFNQKINDALTGKGEEAKDFFKELGVGAAAFKDLDTADRFYKLIAAVKASKSPLGQLGLLMKGVGEDTGKNLGGVLTLTTAQIDELGNAMQSSAADIQTAREAARAQTLAIALMGKAWKEVAAAIGPTVKELAEVAQRNLKPAIEWARANREVIATVFAVSAAAVAAGAGLVVLGAAIKVVTLAYGALAFAALAAKTVVASPFLLGAAAGAGLFLLIANAVDGMAVLKNGAQSAAATIIESWGGIVAAVSKGDLALAGEIAVKGLEVGWREFSAFFETIWSGLKFFASGIWDNIVTGAALSLNDLEATTKSVFDVLETTIGNAFRSIAEVVINEMLKVAKILNTLHPTEALGRVIAFGESSLKLVDGDARKKATDDSEDRIKAIEKERKAIEKGIVDEAELAEMARKKGLVGEADAIEARVKKAKEELAALVARAKQGPGGEFSGGGDFDTTSAGIISGSRGSFTAAAAAQRFGSPDAIPMKQLKAAEKTAENTDAMKVGIDTLAKVFRFK